MTAACDPIVRPYTGITDGYLVTCGCGLDVAYMARDDAEARADRHREGSDADE